MDHPGEREDEAYGVVTGKDQDTLTKGIGMKIRVDPEFQALIPPLQDVELEGLTHSLCDGGCRDKLVVWREEGLLLDGHNRRDICTEYGIEYGVLEVSLPDRNSAKLWIIRNQFSRRNLSNYQRAELALALEPLIAAEAKERQVLGGKEKVHQISGEATTDRQVAAEAGVSHDTIHKAKVIRDHADDETKAKLRDGTTTINKEYTDINRKEKDNARKKHRDANAVQVGKAKSLADMKGLFSTIVIDPPWDWADEHEIGEGVCGRAKQIYASIPIDDLMDEEKYPVGNLAAQDCHLYLWITNRSLPKGFGLLNAWGFRYITCLTWCKPSIGMGTYFRGSTEQVLFGVKGSQPLARHDIGTWFAAPRGPRGHSSKPDEFYNLVATCSPAPRIDIFARSERDKWSTWGGELA